VVRWTVLLGILAAVVILATAPGRTAAAHGMGKGPSPEREETIFYPPSPGPMTPPDELPSRALSGSPGGA